MSSPANVRLCELSSQLDQAWREVYTTAFPLGEQEPEAKLQQLIDTARLLYHRTVGKQGELLCFSMVSLAPDFSFLAYIATDPKQRSGGYGSKHLRALIEQLKQQYPGHQGLFLEIDSTNPRLSKLSDEEKNIRQRRLSFYQRLGAKRLCRNMQYLAPARAGEGEHELDILYFNFSGKTIEHKEKEKIVSVIYERFYELPSGDPLVDKVLSRIKSCTHQKCEEDLPDANLSAPAASAANTAGQTAVASTVTSADAETKAKPADSGTAPAAVPEKPADLAKAS